MKEVYLLIESAYRPRIRVFASLSAAIYEAERKKLRVLNESSGIWELRPIPRREPYGYLMDAHWGFIERYKVET